MDFGSKELSGKSTSAFAVTMAINLSSEARPSVTIRFSLRQAAEHFLEVSDSAADHHHGDHDKSQACEDDVCDPEIQPKAHGAPPAGLAASCLGLTNEPKTRPA